MSGYLRPLFTLAFLLFLAPYLPGQSATEATLNCGAEELNAWRTLLNSEYLQIEKRLDEDGTRPEGRNPPVGVYVYQAQVRLFNGEVVSVAGDVVVMR